ncbi:hypothetical protein JRO89_XS01G0373500 [Xanthoceras sorbifolium]|uniref:methenyltetrahydrofolate cyclohydrolase n=1 Tax=Xanthoceras sorbifolium TaxID=99658 RepID=A0ABQ8INU0_9ROSI|nr:hypothetical protein JRO89_XS01G0373500 [Xanthoceras sorbifolium]
MKHQNVSGDGSLTHDSKRTIGEKLRHAYEAAVVAVAGDQVQQAGRSRSASRGFERRKSGYHVEDPIRIMILISVALGGRYTVDSILWTMASPSDQNATIIDSKAIAQTIRAEIADEVHLLSHKHGKVPGLAMVIVGNRKDSQSYVNIKRKACAEVGIKSFDINLPEQVSESDLISKVHELNLMSDVHGILVQLPLLKHINEEKVLSEISIEKDVDGFHPLNIGKLAMKGREPLFLPCTPKWYNCKGKKAVVVGRSNIVGLPVSLLLLKADAIVTVVHSHSPDPETIIREADIIIAAAGQAMMFPVDRNYSGGFCGNYIFFIYFELNFLIFKIKGSWIKPGAAAIDVGTNAVADQTKKAGYRLVGDVHFEEACKVAGWITPVPGGVGPMTVAMLLRNTLDGAKYVIER